MLEEIYGLSDNNLTIWIQSRFYCAYVSLVTDLDNTVLWYGCSMVEPTTEPSHWLYESH